MAHTSEGIKLENYANQQLAARKIDGSASVIESQGSVDLVVRFSLKGKKVPDVHLNALESFEHCQTLIDSAIENS